MCFCKIILIRELLYFLIVRSTDLTNFDSKGVNLASILTLMHILLTINWRPVFKKLIVDFRFCLFMIKYKVLFSLFPYFILNLKKRFDDSSIVCTWNRNLHFCMKNSEQISLWDLHILKLIRLVTREDETFSLSPSSIRPSCIWLGKYQECES